MSDLDPLTKKKAAQAKINGLKGRNITSADGVYVAVPIRSHTNTDGKTLLYFCDGGSTTQHANLPHKAKLKKGCGQRKNRRDRAGRARHLKQCTLHELWAASAAGSAFPNESGTDGR